MSLHELRSLTIALDSTAISSLSPAPVVLPLATILAHCRVDADLAEMVSLIEDVYFPAALDWAEGAMHRAIVARPHRWVLRGFPWTPGPEIRLPLGQAQSVENIQVSVAGVVTTLTGPSSASPAGTDYREDLTPASGGVLWPPAGGSWPSPEEGPAPVVINFTAGWEVAAIPKEILRALLFATADAVEIPGTGGDLRTSGRMLAIRESLVSSYRLDRWY